MVTQLLLTARVPAYGNRRPGCPAVHWPMVTLVSSPMTVGDRGDSPLGLSAVLRRGLARNPRASLASSCLHTYIAPGPEFLPTNIVGRRRQGSPSMVWAAVRRFMPVFTSMRARVGMTPG